MPERPHTRFIGESNSGSEPPAQKNKVSSRADCEEAPSLGLGHYSENGSLLPSTQLGMPLFNSKPGPRIGLADSNSGGNRKPSRKAPSQVARSNRRAEEFKKKLLASNGARRNSAPPLNGESPTPIDASGGIEAHKLRNSTLSNDPSPQFPPDEDTSKRPEPKSCNQRTHFRDQDISQVEAEQQSEASPSHSNLKAKATSLQRVRKALPIWTYADRIRKALRERNVLLLVGETGSGKSTQVPQFLASEKWCRSRALHGTKNIARADGNGPEHAEHAEQFLTGTSLPQRKEFETEDTRQRSRKVGGCIAVTEPRRVAATTLARRVADEMGSPLGKASPASLVGYSVRFDENTSPGNKIKFLTEGMLLQEMLRDPWLTKYSAVLVDEVHERGVNVDLLLGFLRRMVTRLAKGEPNDRGDVPLKVVVMSATAEGSELVRFFQDGYDECRGEKTQELENNSDRSSEWSGLSDLSAPELIDEDGPSSTRDVASLYFRGRQYPVKILHTPSPVADVIEASLVRIFTITYQEPLPGDILVFLTGQRTVEALCNLIEEYNVTLSKSVPRLMALPLFAALPQEAQRRVFEPVPLVPKGSRGFRKVIVSTNIAETSITVPGVRYVIDGGKEKVKQYRPRIGLDSLLTKSISSSSAIQRAGRAGREAAGCCYRLYSEPDFDKLAERSQPEILRCDLAQAVLSLMARGVPATAVASFPLLTMPPHDSIKAALVQLHQLGAVNDQGVVSDAGHLMATLPVSTSMAKALLNAAEPQMDCLDDMIDLVSAMSGEGIFLPTSDEEIEDGDLASKTPQDDFWRREGDHATMIMAVRGFAAENGDRRRWAEARGLSWRAMRGIMDIRKQLLGLRPRLAQVRAEEVGLPNADVSSNVSPNTLRCLLAGFPLNAAILAPDGSYRTISGRQTVAIHPSSVLFHRPSATSTVPSPKPTAIIYTEFVYTTKAYARGVSAVEVDWILEALGADWKKVDHTVHD